MNDRVFDIIRECFVWDSGSLPAVEVSGITAEQVVAIYTWIRSNARVSSADYEIWNNRLNQSQPLDSVENAAALVVSGKVQPFIFHFTDLRIGGEEIPRLGLFVSANSVEFDYCGGPEWTRAKIGAFLSFLRSMHEIAPDATIEMIEGEVFEQVRERFNTGWKMYCGEGSAR